jgi:type II secretory pathway pseudopilin PulG
LRNKGRTSERKFTKFEGEQQVHLIQKFRSNTQTLTTTFAAKRRRHLGSTLIEVMLAIAILIIALVGTSSTYVAGRRYIVNQRYYQAAAQLASEKLEEVKADGYLGTPVGQEQEELSMDGFTYTRTTQTVLTSAPSASVPQPCKKVTVTIQWAGLVGDQHEAKLITYIGP